jgi:hypothetical protein
LFHSTGYSAADTCSFGRDLPAKYLCHADDQSVGIPELGVQNCHRFPVLVDDDIRLELPVLTLKEKFVFLEVASYDTVRSRQMALQHVDKVVFSQFAHIQEIGEESLRRVSGSSTVKRGHEHHRSMRCFSVREGRPRGVGGVQRGGGT